MEIRPETILHDYFGQLALLKIVRDKKPLNEDQEKIILDRMSLIETDFLKGLSDLRKKDYEDFRQAYRYFACKFLERNGSLDETDEWANKRINRIFFAVDGELYKEVFGESERLMSTKGKHQNEETLTTNKSNKEKAQVPHFKSLNLKEKEAPILYKRLVEGGYLEDTGEEDFVYYFTGKGKQAQNRLKWRKDALILSVLMQELCGDRIQWSILEAIFDGLNTKSMRSSLAQTKKESKEGTNYSFAKHHDKVKQLLSNS